MEDSRGHSKVPLCPAIRFYMFVENEVRDKLRYVEKWCYFLLSTTYFGAESYSFRAWCIKWEPLANFNDRIRALFTTRISLVNQNFMDFVCLQLKLTKLTEVKNDDAEYSKEIKRDKCKERSIYCSRRSRRRREGCSSDNSCPSRDRGRWWGRF